MKIIVHIYGARYTFDLTRQQYRTILVKH